MQGDKKKARSPLPQEKKAGRKNKNIKRKYKENKKMEAEVGTGSTLVEQRGSVCGSSNNDEALLVLCDETKRSRLEEYLASPVFGCLPIAPSDFQSSGTPPLPAPVLPSFTVILLCFYFIF